MKKKEGSYGLTINEKHTVLVENYMLDKDTGLPVKCGFVFYSAPTSPTMAQSLAAQLRMCGKSYRIVTKDNKPGAEIIEQWWRKDFVPDDCNKTNLKGE